MTDDITQGEGSGRPPGCSCHPDDRPPVCQKEHATTHCKLAYAEAEIREAREIVHDTPVLKIDVKVARMRGEIEAIEYTKKLVEWNTRARAFLTKGETDA